MNDLRADALSWRIKQNVIVDQVSVSFGTGEFTGLIGPNGCGKTSLLHLLAGLTTPTAGRAVLGSEALAAIDRRSVARRMALVEQLAGTDLDLTVAQVVSLGRTPHQVGWFDADDRALIEDCLEQVRALPLEDRFWNELSGGERQKVHLARALAQQPEILLLDEPTNHLDVSAALSLMSLVRRLDVSVVAAIHDINLAAAFCDRLVVMKAGRIVAEGPPESVLTSELLAEVYAVDASVGQHPRTGKPLVIFDGARPDA